MKLAPASCGLLATMAVAGLFAVRWFTLEPDISQLVVEGRSAVERQQLQLAASLASRILKYRPEHPEGLLLSAVIAAEQGAFREAVEYCRRVPGDTETTFADARLMAGRICLDQLGQVSESEQLFREVVTVAPTHFAANERIVYVLGLQARSWELIPFQLQLLRQSQKQATRIQLLMQGELSYPDAELIQQLRSTDPGCAGLLLAEARIRLLAKDYGAARSFCQQAILLQNDFPEAHAEMARILLQEGAYELLPEWYAALPQTAWRHPYVLYTAGRVAQQELRQEQAARCFWESLKIDPNSASANYQLGQSLISLGRALDARVFLDRSAQLERYQNQLGTSAAVTSAEAAAPDKFNEFLQSTLISVELAESLGLIWETYAWASIAEQAPTPPAWAKQKLRAIRPQLTTLALQRTQPEDNPATQVDLTMYPLPQPETFPTAIRTTNSDMTTPVPAASSSSALSFVEHADEVGLRFVYNNGFPHPREAQIRPFDFTGGGTGVIDVNSDGWPDLYFPQGCAPATRDTTTREGLNDRLFLNLQGQQFLDISHVAIPHTIDYGQGVAVGDYDSDGLPDLLIANLGRNRLLRNNGDGTFSDDSDAIDGDSRNWTSSCLICDLNHDGHPDLYFVNYLSGEILNRICSNGTQRFGNCAPQDFPAAQDQLFLNQGDGRFVEVTAECGIEVPNGKGLGIIAADLNHDNRIDLFIANDGVPNFYFKNLSTEQTGLRFSEVAFTHGLAVNAEGRSEACMGIVAEDLNADGRLDLFVTNFLEETNTLYRNSTDFGMFLDVTPQSLLGAPSLQMLGFGTQAIDGALDGHLDLVVTNGHVDSYPHKDVPYRMRPQYFRNRGNLTFEEVSATSLGPYFERTGLGRSMARLDWNRDGAEDLVITDLDAPVALLTNSTQQRGHFLKIRLIGQSLNRDAIGASLRIRTPTAFPMRQLNAGDGYMASNERRLIFGLGSENQISELIVCWPSGAVETFHEVPGDTDLIVIEGRGILLPDPQ